MRSEQSVLGFEDSIDRTVIAWLLKSTSSIRRIDEVEKTSKL